MADDFDNLMQQIEDEAQADGPAGVAELRELQAQFRFGAMLFRRRQDLGLSQASLSDRCGVPQADISRIERGQGNPTIATVERLVRAMGGGSVEITWTAS